MPTPRIPHSLQILLDDTVVGAVVTLINRTTGEVLRRNQVSGGRVSVSAADFTSGYTNGDVIQVQCSAQKFGFSTVTIDVTDPVQDVSITTTATNTTNSPAVNL